MFNFKKKACVLHHFAFLDWLPTHYFLSPITHFQPLKTHFLTTILPFSAMCFMVLRGYVYTIVVHIYAFHLAFSSILHCVLHHFTLRFVPFYLAFCTKMQCVLHQNALHLAAYCTTFSTKQPQNGCKWRPLQINIHFAMFTSYPHFTSKRTAARIDFLGQEGEVVDKKAAIVLKNIRKSGQKMKRQQVG